MEASMDKRIIRTKRAIRSAFLDLRKEQPLEEIKVIDICALSVINKTTFYKYYTDIFDLNAAIENEVFTAFMEDFTEFHSLFINTSGFIQNLNDALAKQGPIFYTLFSDRVDKFFSMLERAMKAYYLDNPPSNLSLLKTDFILAGVIHTFKEMQLNRNYDLDLMIRELEEIIRAVSVYAGQ